MQKSIFWGREELSSFYFFSSLEIGESWVWNVRFFHLAPEKACHHKDKKPLVKFESEVQPKPEFYEELT